jgi:hypothetical protein
LWPLPVSSVNFPLCRLLYSLETLFHTHCMHGLPFTKNPLCLFCILIFSRRCTLFPARTSHSVLESFMHSVNSILLV